MRGSLAAVALMATISSTAIAQIPISTEFQWPEEDAAVIPDARLSDLIRRAREAEQNALGRARAGERIASEAKRRERLKGFFGNDSKPQTIDAGTIMTAFPYDTESGFMLGVVTYPSGATMTGIFGPDEGRYVAPPESTVREFLGWVFNARTSSPSPMEGVFSMKNGDTFIGTIGADADGIYRSAGGERRFVGKFDASHGSIQPLAGIMEDKRGRLIAILRPVR